MLKNASLRNKLIVVAAIPLLILLVVAVLSALDRRSASNAADDARRHGELLLLNGDLIAALGVEALDNQNSAYASSGELSASQARTDDAQAAWLSRAGEFSALDEGAAEALVQGLDGHRLGVSSNFGSGADGVEPIHRLDLDLATALAATERTLIESLDGDVSGLLRRTNVGTEALLRTIDAGAYGQGAIQSDGQIGIDGRIAAADAAVAGHDRVSPSGNQIGAAPATLDALHTAAIDSSAAVDAATWRDAYTARIGEVTSARSMAVEVAIGDAADASSSASGAMRNLALAALLGLLLPAALIALIGRRASRDTETLEANARLLAENEIPLVGDALRSGAEIDTPRDSGLAESIDDPELRRIAEQLDASRASLSALGASAGEIHSGVSQTFVSLARRSQAMVDRQLEAIDVLEAKERDPDRLALLYRVDHLATRMRRNAESLLVLAGTQTHQRRTDAVELREVLRVAIGEVEDYRRIIPISMDDQTVAGHHAQELAHLLAELMENAAQQSPPGTAVDVMGARDSDGVYTIRIIDRGTGIDAEQMEALNALLASDEAPTVTLGNAIGLRVVSRLSSHLGLTVRLAPTSDGGTCASVHVPSHVVDKWDQERPPSAEPSATAGTAAPLTPATDVPQPEPQPAPAASIGFGEPTSPDVAVPTVAEPVDSIDGQPVGAAMTSGVTGFGSAPAAAEATVDESMPPVAALHESGDSTFDTSSAFETSGETFAPESPAPFDTTNSLATESTFEPSIDPFEPESATSDATIHNDASSPSNFDTESAFSALGGHEPAGVDSAPDPMDPFAAAATPHSLPDDSIDNVVAADVHAVDAFAPGEVIEFETPDSSTPIPVVPSAAPLSDVSEPAPVDSPSPFDALPVPEAAQQPLAPIEAPTVATPVAESAPTPTTEEVPQVPMTTVAPAPAPAAPLPVEQPAQPTHLASPQPDAAPHVPTVIAPAVNAGAATTPAPAPAPVAVPLTPTVVPPTAIAPAMAPQVNPVPAVAPEAKTPSGLVRRQRSEPDASNPLDDSRSGPSRRSPDQVRSMLSRYKTGLERGRTTTDQDGAQ